MDDESVDRKAEALFTRILELGESADREAALTKEDEQVARRALALLRAYERAGAFMGRPGDLDQTQLDEPRGHPEDEPGTVIDRYKLLEKIGEGGFGVVYMAEQTEPVRRRVALKIIKLGMDTRQVVARFEAERQALALMDHPNIAAVHDAGATESGRPYFVMELVKGLPITQFCNEQRLDTGQRLRLFQQVCGAVQHAHQKGVIHRDLKPSNVMVSLHGDDPVPKVIDFGIAKATNQQLTEKTLFTNFGQFIGTPAYMSPEQANLSGLDVDTRSDIYSLGVILYELLTGKTPVDSRTLRSAGYHEICRVIREQDPPRPSNRLSTLGERELTEVARERAANPKKLGVLIRHDLDWVVMKSLEKEPSQRYETAHGLSLDIDRFLKNEPVNAAAPSAVYRLKKFYRRHRLVASLVTVILAALVSGITVSAWQAVRATRAERKATEAAGRESVARQAETAQRREAQAERARAIEALYRLRYHTADDLITRGRVAEGIASLARLVRDHPERPESASRLLSSLRHGSFALPIDHPASRHQVGAASVDSSGMHLFTLDPDGAGRMWDVKTGRPLWGPRDLGITTQHVAHGPKGRHIALWKETEVVVIDATSGELVGEPMEHEGKILHVWFSRDGNRLVSGTIAGTARLWKPGDTSAEAQTLSPGGWVQWGEFSPDGSQVVTCSRVYSTSKAQLWDTATGELLRTIDDFEDVVQCARFSQDGRTLFTASNDRTIRFYDPTTGGETNERIHHPRGFAFFRVHPSPDETRLLTVSIDEHSARIWDAVTGKPVGEPMIHEDRVYFASWNSDGTRVLTRSQDQTVRVWNGSTGEPVTEPLRHQNSLNQAGFLPGSKVFTTDYSNNLTLWDVRPGAETPVLMPHQEGLYGARFTEDGTGILSCSSDGTACLWNAETGRLLVDPLESATGERRYVFDARFSPDGRLIVTASGDGHARLWDRESGAQLFKLGVSEKSVRVVSFSPDGEILATGSDDGMVGLWSTRTGERLAGPVRAVPDEQGGWNMIWSIQFSVDGRRLLTAGTDGTARLWALPGVTPLGTPMRHESRVASAWFSPDEGRIITASDDRTARQWDATTCEPIGPPLTHDENVTTARYSPAGDLIATGSEDGTIRLWDSESGEPVVPPMRHDGIVWTVRFDPAGERLVSASEDGTVRIWDVRLGLPLSAALRHGTPVSDARFSPDGSRLLSAAGDGARLWLDVSPAQLEPVPTWLPDWAEAVVSLRFDGKQVPTFVSRDEFFGVRTRIVGSVESGPLPRFGKWFFFDRETRPRFLGAPPPPQQDPGLPPAP